MTDFVWNMPVKNFAIGIDPNQLTPASPFTRSQSVIDFLGERWRISLTVPPAVLSSGAAREAFMAKLRGKANRVQMWHMVRPVPVGTMRGTPTLSGAHAQGASTLTLTGATGTLKAGDMLGVNGMLVMVSDDTSGTGTMTVNLCNRLRSACSSGTAVVWSRPMSTFILAEGYAPSRYTPGVNEELSIELLESW